jgi:UDP-GlcNAc:undecaprenyl-phosphate GlcNAc-1-phosphate transferase
MLLKNSFILIGIAFILPVILTPLAKWLSFKLQVLDQPNERKIHREPIPLMGGEVIFLSTALVLMIFAPLDREFLSLLLFGAIFILFGLIDDKGIKIPALIKVSAHLLFSIAFIYSSGISFNFFRYDWLNLALTAGFITFMTNSMNMLDGMDGLVSGVSFLASGFFAILALNSGQKDLFLLSLAVMGVTLGFLRYNFNPASIFLGEAGATVLGFFMAILAVKLNIYGLWTVALLLGLERLQVVSFIIPLIILGIPIFDTYFVFTNRFLHKVKFNQPGKDHSHHRIHLMGLSQRATVLILYTIQVVLGAIALAMVRADVQQFFALLLIVGIFFVGFTVLLNQVEVYS